MKHGILSLQYEPRINDRIANFEIIEELISPYKERKIDMVVFPEFFSTGISHDGFIEHAENENKPFALNFASSIAKKYSSYVCAGSVIEKDGKKLYNTSYVFDRKGEIIGKYRKIHLYSFFGGTEHEVITAGNTPAVFELDFAVIGLAVCFDIRFPLHFNKLAQMGAELILCPNAWCVPKNSDSAAVKKEEAKAFAIARASENLVYFAGSSFSGSLGSGLVSCAQSVIVSPVAGSICYAENKQEAIFAQVDFEGLRKIRKENPVHLIS